MDNNTSKIGRPPLYKSALVRIGVSLPDEMYNWLLSQPDGAYGALRRLIEDAMKKDKKNDVYNT